MTQKNFHDVIEAKLKPYFCRTSAKMKAFGKIVKFTDFVSFPLKFFEVLGINNFQETDRNVPWGKKFLKKIYQKFVIAQVMLLLIGSLIYFIQHIRHMSVIIEVIMSLGYASMVVVKLLLIPSRTREFKDLLKTLSEMFPKTQRDQNAFGTRKYFTYFNIMKHFLGFMLIMGGAKFIIGPIVEFVTTGNWIAKQPPMWYPFDENDPRFFILVQIWHIFLATVIGSSFLGPDIILFSFITLISMEFDILCRKLEDLNLNDLTYDHTTLKELIRTHQTLIRLSDNLEEIFSIPIFVNFFESSTLLCLFAYEISTAKTVGHCVEFGTMLTTALVHTLLFCYYGNKLMSASGRVALAAYNSKWYCKELEQGKSLILMMQRAQRPSVLTAYKFAVISLEIFAIVSLLEFVLSMKS